MEDQAIRGDREAASSGRASEAHREEIEAIARGNRSAEREGRIAVGRTLRRGGKRRGVRNRFEEFAAADAWKSAAAARNKFAAGSAQLQREISVQLRRDNGRG